MARRSADSLIDNPVFQQQAQPPELPVRTALSKLTTTKGDDLEMTTRATPQIVRAAQVGYIYARIYGSSYIQGRVEQMERLAVSMGGQGRRDLIDTVEAGGRMMDPMPDGAGRRRYRDALYIRDDDY